MPFQVLLDGEELDATPIAGGAWGFGTPVDSVYPYEVRWNESSRTFTFNINVPVENAKPVVLNYKLQWNGEGEEEVDVDTNASTTIEYWPSNDPDGESTTEPYESPVVIYRSTTDYAVTKVWDDADNVDAIRPESIDVQLYADGEPSGEPIRLDEEHHWTYTWTGLYKYSDGDAIDYEVKEVETPDGYEVAIAEATDGTEATITNSHTPEVTTVSVTKTWDDADNQDGIRPTANEFAANMILSADGSDVTEQYADKMSVEDNEDGTYTITWTDLPKFAGSTTPINYEVEEVAIDGYVASITSNVDGTFAITNKHEPATIDINVTKTWDDVDDRDGIRPDTITVKLLADGKEVATAEFGEPEGWKYTFTDMPKYSEGKEIAYTIEEVEVEGYSSAVAGDATNGFVIANVHKSEPAPGTVDVTVDKVWDDKDDKDGIRPASVTVSIIANGAFTGVQLELSEANGWKATATGLPKSIDGKDATYTVEEDTVPEGYTATVKMDGTTFTVTNTHEPKKPDVPKTGDPTVLLPMAGVLGTLGVAAAYVLKGKARKNR